MPDPLVCAIMLTRHRPQMVARAIASFRSQAYPRKRLIVYNTNDPVEYGHIPSPGITLGDGVSEVPAGPRGLTIGTLRNAAIGYTDAEIIVHMDDDDVSHPQRIAEQVALLQSSGADCVGYYEAPFYDQRPGAFAGTWMYRDPARKHVLGASLCYWRKTWERNPFDDVNTGEDARFAQRCKTVAVSGIPVKGDVHSYDAGVVWKGECAECGEPQSSPSHDGQPRLICGVHGSNTSDGYNFSRRLQCFKRAAQWDSFCQEAMKL